MPATTTPPLTPNRRIAWALDPALVLDELRFERVDWQRRVMRSQSRRILLNCHRQSGKSWVTASLAVWTAMYQPGALVLMVSASQRQSSELFLKATGVYEALGRPIAAAEDTATTLGLSNGSRVVSLPDSPDTIVGYSAPRLIVADEAARISDEMLLALLPMLITNAGRLILMSTPKGKRGLFHQAWTADDASWERVLYRASDNPRLDPAELAEHRAILGQLGYEQEYEGAFNEASGQLFTEASIAAALDCDRAPIFGG
jgi:hypothetical protein